MIDLDSITDTVKLYVIGDIHGRLDLLEQLIDQIHQDAKGRESFTVTLGDYVDRGHNSSGVLERLSSNPFPGPYVALKGNHEELFERFLRDPGSGDSWRDLGGLETLQSFGVSIKRLMLDRNYHDAAARLRACMTPLQRQFLRTLRMSVTFGSYYMCHAGVRPGVPLVSQNDRDLLWIRDEFLRSKADFGKIVVHGHSPVEEPQSLSNRINVDTGAYITGRLTCAVLIGKQRHFLST